MHRFTFRSVLLIVLLAAGVSTAMAKDGRVFSMKGQATVNGQPLTRTTPINGGDIIQTSEDSTVKLIMSDRTVVDIKPETEFKISEFNFDKAKPERGKSVFSLLKGSFRYISGLIAKASPKRVSMKVGTATIGIRGTFQSFTYDGVNIQVDAGIGVAIITFPPPPGSPPGTQPRVVKIDAGKTGHVNTQTGKAKVVSTPQVDNVVQAAKQVAQDPTDQAKVDAAMAGLSQDDQALALATLTNNTDGLASELGLDATNLQNNLAQALGNMVRNDPANAGLLVFVASVLNPAAADANMLAAQAAVDAALANGEITQEQADKATGDIIEARTSAQTPAAGPGPGTPPTETETIETVPAAPDTNTGGEGGGGGSGSPS